MVTRAVKIRIYPNQKQVHTLNCVLGCYRYVYNHMLDYRDDLFYNQGIKIGVCEMSKHFHQEMLKDPELHWLKEQNTKVMKQSIRQLDTAYKRFFEGNGHPKKKHKKDKQSALFPIDAISKKNTFETRHISLTKDLKNIHFRCSNLYLERLRKYKSNIKSATLSKTKTGKYYLSVLIEMDEKEFLRFQKTGDMVGVDLGVKDFAITSDAEIFENPHYFKKDKRKLKRLYRQWSKKKKGSKNREKVRHRLAVVYERQANRRENYIHSIVNSLLRSYDFIFTEDLNVSGMMRNHKLSATIHELGLYRFKEVLVNKAMLNDKYVVPVGRFFPSTKRCHGCGYINRNITLNDREWDCPECGMHHDRDINAALNILMEGQRLIGCRTPEFTPAENPPMDDRHVSGLKSSGSLKQEATDGGFH